MQSLEVGNRQINLLCPCLSTSSEAYRKLLAIPNLGRHEVLSSSYLNYEITHLKETERWFALVSSVLKHQFLHLNFFLSKFCSFIFRHVRIPQQHYSSENTPRFSPHMPVCIWITNSITFISYHRIIINIARFTFNFCFLFLFVF